MDMIYTKASNVYINALIYCPTKRGSVCKRETSSLYIVMTEIYTAYQYIRNFLFFYGLFCLRLVSYPHPKVHHLQYDIMYRRYDQNVSGPNMHNREPMLITFQAVPSLKRRALSFYHEHAATSGHVSKLWYSHFRSE